MAEFFPKVLDKNFGSRRKRLIAEPRGVLEVYMTGGSDVFFWVENLHTRYFFGSRDLSRIFSGLKKIRVFFWVLSERTFRLGYSLRSVDQKNIYSREDEETLTDTQISKAY